MEVTIPEGAVAIPLGGIRNHRRVIVAYALVSQDDAQRVLGFRWSLHNFGYAQTTINRKTVLLHNFISGELENGLTIDHINNDPKDNRRENLRLATKRQQTLNRGQQRNNTSGFIGVSFHQQRGKWQAYCKMNGRQKSIGYFTTAEAAAKARDTYALDQTSAEDRPFLRLNFTTESAVHPELPSSVSL